MPQYSSLEGKTRFCGLHGTRLRVAQGGLVGLVLLLILALVLALTIRPQKPNVIFMISDGMGPAALTLARAVGPLSLDSALAGTARTYSANSLVTDSAAGATAYSCAHKTNNDMVAVYPNQTACPTLLEAFKKRGYKTAMVVTSRITHATPGSFSAHSADRNWEEFIAEQQAVAGIDILFGGGRDMFVARKDGRNLSQDMVDAGYTYITTQEQLNATDLRMPVVGLFAASMMDYEIDRTTQPSLTMMVERALSLLEASGEPFFMLIEGSRIDMAAHNNDPATQLWEVVQYDQAFMLASAYAEKSKTVVVSSSDHETGGLSLGYQPDLLVYPQYEWLPEVLYKARHSVEWMMTEVFAGADLATVVRNNTDIQLTPEEILFIEQIRVNSSNNYWTTTYALGQTLAHYAMLGYSTHGHTGVDVNYYLAGTDLEWEGQRMAANVDNTDLGQAIIDQFSLSSEMEEVGASLVGFVTHPVGVATTPRPTQRQHN